VAATLFAFPTLAPWVWKSQLSKNAGSRNPGLSDGLWLIASLTIRSERKGRLIDRIACLNAKLRFEIL